jgi:hypothetical protein
MSLIETIFRLAEVASRLPGADPHGPLRVLAIARVCMDHHVDTLYTAALMGDCVDSLAIERYVDRNCPGLDWQAWSSARLVRFLENRLDAPVGHLGSESSAPTPATASLMPLAPKAALTRGQILAQFFPTLTGLPEFLAANSLAEILGKPATVVEIFLRRFRKKFTDCFVEVEGRRKGEPRYLYRTSDVLAALVGHFGPNDD